MSAESAGDRKEGRGPRLSPVIRAASPSKAPALQLPSAHDQDGLVPVSMSLLTADLSCTPWERGGKLQPPWHRRDKLSRQLSSDLFSSKEAILFVFLKESGGRRNLERLHGEKKS